MGFKLFYLDTCIWRDFYEDRYSKSGKPFGKYAADLFIKILNKKYKILYSETLLWELNKDYDKNEIRDMLNFLLICKVLVKIEITKKEFIESKKLAKERNIPFIDCINAIQARNHRATMVSQDKHFFENLSDIVKTVRPEEII
jgi:PIN domain nuclease of toxin-antitoxin system